MKRHTPGSEPALIRALGPNPLSVVIGGTSWPADMSSGFSMRRARPGRDPIGEPASCSVTVAVDALPDWAKGDQFTVELSDTALDRLFGTQTELYYNLVPNPGLNYPGTGGWVALGGGAIAVAVDATEPRSDSGDNCLKVTCAADLDGARNSPTAETPGSEVIPAGWPLQASAWIKAAPGETVRVRLEHGYSATDDPAVVQIVDEQIVVGDGTWRPIQLDGVTTSVRNYTPLLRFVSTSGAQVFYVDSVLITVPTELGRPVPYFDGNSPNGAANPAAQFLGYTVTHSWQGTVNLSWSTRFVDKLPAIEQARRRFVGRLSDLRLRSRRKGLSFVELIGVGNLARLGGITIGDEPWPAELVATRAGRILSLAQAKGGPAYTIGASSAANVQNKDVDRRSATELLTDLARTAGARHGLTEKRNGGLLWSAGYADDSPAVAVPASLVPAELEHDQGEVINDVTVLYGPEDGPAAGVVLHTNMVTNPSFEVDGLRWGRSSTSLSLARDTAVAAGAGVASLKIAATAALTNPFVQTDLLPGVVPGRRYFGRVRIRPSKAGTSGRVIVRFYDDAGALVSVDGPPTGPALTLVNGWQTLTATSAPAPATATQARLLVQWITPQGTADTWWIDAALLRELRGDETPALADYFDGSTPAGGGYVYGWNGTAHASTSERRASGDKTPRLEVRAIDAASVAAHGRYPVTLDTQLDQYSNVNGTVYDRGVEEWLPGGWELPPLSFDLCQLLDGRADNAFAYTSNGATTPTELAQQLARVELGSYLTIDGPGYYAGDPFDVDHLPASSIDAPGRVTALNESITAHGWSLTTEQERTT